MIRAATLTCLGILAIGAQAGPVLRLDPKYGFPIHWVVDDVHNGYAGYYVTDQDYWGEVDRFAPLRECGFFSWRRLFGTTRLGCLN